MTTLRVWVWNAEASSRLEDAAGFLPCISLPAGTRPDAPAIVGALHRQLGLDAVVVRIATHDLVEVELIGAARADLVWRQRTPDPLFADRQVWHRPGWLGQILETVDLALADIGVTRTGRPVQTRHTSVTAMLRVPTDDGAVWLKFVAPIFDVERSLVTWLGSVLPGQIPEVRAQGTNWWLSAPFPPEAAQPSGDVLTFLGQLQIATVGRIGELRDLGCPHRPLGGLPSELELAARCPDLLDREHQEMLQASLMPLEKLCKIVDDLGLPETLVHGDLTRENVRWTGRGWFVFDWTDGCITHPFVDLELALDAGPRERRAERARSYASAWATIGLGGAADRAIVAAPAIGAAHQVATYRWILNAIRVPGGDESGLERLRFLVHHWTRQLAATVNEVSS